MYFISTESLEVFTSLYVNATKYEYVRGLLFQYRDDGIVRILVVASKTHLNDLRLPFRQEDEQNVKMLIKWASSNSNVIVMGWQYSKDFLNTVPHLSVYDLEAVKKPNSDPDSYLLYILQFKFNIIQLVMNEKFIAFLWKPETKKHIGDDTELCKHQFC